MAAMEMESAGRRCCICEAFANKRFVAEFGMAFYFPCLFLYSVFCHLHIYTYTGHLGPSIWAVVSHFRGRFIFHSHSVCFGLILLDYYRRTKSDSLNFLAFARYRFWVFPGIGIGIGICIISIGININI